MIEGMACPGGCVAGAGTLIDVDSAKKEIAKMVSASTSSVPPLELKDIELD